MVLRPHGYEWEWYEEAYRESIRIQSCTQSGKSEFINVSLFSGAYDFNWRTFHITPTQLNRDTYITNRLEKQIKSIPWYRDRLADADADNKSLKIFAGMHGPVAIRFAYSMSEAQVVEFPADRVIVDEYDNCDELNVKIAHRRMDASDHRISQMVSNPRIANTGISREMQRTDHRRWHERCQHDCHRPDGTTHYNNPDFYRHVVDPEGRPRDPHFNGYSGLRMVCSNCHRPIDDGYRRARGGLWIPTASGHGLIRGYYVSKMFAGRVPLTELYQRYKFAQSDDGEMQSFENDDLGMARRGEGSQITEELLNQCIDAEYSLPKAITDTVTCIGIDPGKPIYYDILNPRGDFMDLIATGSVEDEESLHMVIQRYRAFVGVVDQGPELQMVRNLMARYSNFWRCRYLPGTGGRQEVEREVGTGDSWIEQRTIKVDRTVALDNVKTALFRKLIRLPQNARSLDNGRLYSQLQSSNRVYDHKRETYVWTKEGADHHHHSMGYAIMARNVALQLAA